MQFILLFTFLCPILVNLVNVFNVIADSSLDCSTTNGQIVRLDWTNCNGEKYKNLKPVISSVAQNYVVHLPGQDTAKICFKDQFVIADIYLDNGLYGSNQQKLHIYENKDNSLVHIISHEFDDTGNVIKSYPTIISIREAKFVGTNAPSETLSSYSKEDDEMILNRPPNSDLSITYC